MRSFKIDPDKWRPEGYRATDLKNKRKLLAQLIRLEQYEQAAVVQADLDRMEEHNHSVQLEALCDDIGVGLPKVSID